MSKSRPRRALLALALVVLTSGAPHTVLAGSSTENLLPSIFSSSVTTHKVVALTFDDGPSPYSPAVIDLLHRYGAVATFFLVGMRVERYPATVREEARNGDALGNHTYTHADLQWLTAATALWQIQRTQADIHGATGMWSHWFRPPYGAVDGRIVSLAASQGLHTVTWSVDPRDWSLPGVGAIVMRVLAAVRPGSIVVMHDGGGDRSETVAALAALLPALRSRGYRFITLDEMFFPPRREQHAARRPAYRRPGRKPCPRDQVDTQGAVTRDARTLLELA